MDSYNARHLFFGGGRLEGETMVKKYGIFLNSASQEDIAMDRELMRFPKPEYPSWYGEEVETG